MSLLDTNAVIWTYLTTLPALNSLTLLVGTRIYCPRLPENVKLITGVASTPAISFSIRGGTSTPYIPDLASPSVQFDCWAMDAPLDTPAVSGPLKAREVYRALYDNLQGIQNTAVGANVILSAIEEMQGQDLVDTEIPNYFRVLTFFEIQIR